MSNKKHRQPHERITPQSEGIMVAESFQGPIPPPNVLERYNAINPEIPLMIMNMAVKEQEHRHSRRNTKSRSCLAEIRGTSRRST